MARVTVEDCAQVVSNRYELVLLGAQRARDISAGAMITVDRDNDKNTVVALREIADQTINLDELRRHIARGVNRQAEMSAEDEALLALTENAFGTNAALDAAEEMFSEVEYEAEDSDSSESEEGSDSEESVAEEDVSDEDVAAAMASMMENMNDLSAEEDEDTTLAVNS